ncbi:MAG: 3-phosphoserine/phosphohydroxythreonine transaminase [Thermoanaerobaculia bacterium]|nr:3-phosphoserine/phosphohydroxythreonine transaminase [Thermoanaerobaculia bacterium]
MSDSAADNYYRVTNFSAGPATLPLEVLEQAQADLVDYQGSGMSVMEMSHRSPVYDAIHHGLMTSLRRLLHIGDDYDILLLQGGASLQFTMVPMNLLPKGRSADYVVTGAWAKKALAEAGKVGRARAAVSTANDNFQRLPAIEDFEVDPEATYLHLTTNNTIAGTQWHDFPTSEAPLVLDASSDILSRPMSFDGVGLVYAGAQKNLGPAGLTVVIVRRDLLDHVPEGLPTMLDYRTHASKDSLFNTPPCWSIYVAGLACAWLEKLGGLEAIATRNRNKADIIYSRLTGGFYRSPIDPASRSLMNVVFRLRDESLESEFLSEAAKAGLVNLKGHRSVGGIRASLYNALPVAGVKALADFMDDFEAHFA